MRILHVVRQFSPAIGGLENFVLCLARAQSAAGMQPEVLTLDRVFHRGEARLPAEEEIEGIPVRRIAWRGSHRYPLAFSAALKLNGYDLIHVHAIDFFADYLPWLRAFHQTPMVLSTHGGFFHSGYAARLKKLFFHTVTRSSLRAYKRVIACSEGDYTLFAPLCRPWLELIENGVDIEKFGAAGPRQLSPSLLFIGRFSDNKRLDRLIDTVFALRRRLPAIRLSLVGRDWDGNFAKLRQRIEQLDLSREVRIIVDPSDARIREQVARHSFIVSASEHEGFGLTLVEGMAAGLLPIASPIPSFRRIVEEAGVGRLVDFSDPEQAALDIEGYLRHAADCHDRLRAEAIEAAQRYGWDGTAARFTRVYESVIGARTRRIQGVAIDTRSGEEVIRAIEQAVSERSPLNIAIANAHTINQARSMPGFRALLENFLVLNDGIGVNLASRWKYRKPFCENLNGTDFVPRLLASSTRPLRVFLIGARLPVVEAAWRNFARAYPRHQWVGYQDGYAPPEAMPALCARLRGAWPDLVLVAMGNPRQEEWIARYGKDCGAPVCIGVGALFDFIAGEVRRAPPWVRRLRCEWIYRLLQEPGRLWRRYLIGNLAFLWAARSDQR